MRTALNTRRTADLSLNHAIPIAVMAGMTTANTQAMALSLKMLEESVMQD
jgi:hypothetical protein